MRRSQSRQKWFTTYDGHQFPRYRLYPGTRYSAEVKAQACELKKQGKTYTEICRELDIGPTNRTLVRWFKEGGVYDPPEKEEG